MRGQSTGLVVFVLCLVVGLGESMRLAETTIVGRHWIDPKSKVAWFDWPGVVIEHVTSGVRTIEVVFDDILNIGGDPDTVSNLFEIVVDGETKNVTVLQLEQPGTGEHTYTVSTGLDPSKQYVVSLTKRTEALSLVGFVKFIDDGEDNAEFRRKAEAKSRRIEFLGDSVACGYGDECPDIQTPFSAQTENVYLAYGPLVARNFSAEYHMEAISGIGVVRNFGDPQPVSDKPFKYYKDSCVKRNVGESFKWDYSTWTPHAIVIHLGGNDYSTLPHPPKETFVEGYKSLVSSYLDVYSPHPAVFLTSGPMYGDPVSYVEEVVGYFKAKGEAIAFVDWTQVFDKGPDLQGCQTHPNVKAHMIMATILEDVMHEILGW